MADILLPRSNPIRVESLGLLDKHSFTPDVDLDALVQIASLVCETPISLVSLIGEDRQWFKAQVGLPGLHETPREVSFCAHAIQQDDLFEIHDAQRDARFSDNPLVTAAPGIRFYAGAPLLMGDGANAGALCVIDTRPRVLTALQRAVLLHLAKVAAHVLKNQKSSWDTALLVAEFKAFDEFAPLGIFATNPSGLCVKVNPNWMSIYELDVQQSLGAGWVNRIHPEDRATVLANWQEAAKQPLDFDMEFRLLFPDDRIKTVRALSRAFNGPDGSVAGHIGSVEDVTQSRSLQRRLDTKRARLAAILDSTGAATFEWNVQTGETRVSEAWARMTGNVLADFDAVTEQTWTAQIHPDDRQMLAAKHQQHFANPVVPYEAELRKRHVDGHWVWLLNWGQITSLLPDGRPEWVSGVQIDITSRKRQEEALRKSESLLTKTGEVAGIGGWDLDLISNRLSWTDQTCRIHGLAPGFKPDLAQAINFYAPSSRPVIQAAVEAAVASGQPWDLELQLMQPDGRQIWVRAVGSVDFDGQTPIRLYGAFQDINDRILQQRLMQDEHQRMTLAKESGGIGIWEWEPEGNIATWDQQMFRLYGYPQTQELTATMVWQQGLHLDDQQAVQAATAKALQTGTRFDAEFRVVWPDGSVHILRSMADVSGQPGAGRKLIGVNWDVTATRANERNLAEQHQLMQVTLRSIGDAVITTDAQGKVTWLNPVGEMLTGWPLDEAMGRPLSQIFNIINEATLKPTENPVEACLAMGKAVETATGSTVLISRDGLEFGIENSAAPIKDDAGTLHGVVLVFNDVTTERRISGEVAYRATHDPLTGTKNRTEFEHRLTLILQRSIEDASKHALLFIDLDQFKRINDTCGHSAGDDALQQISKILAGSIRSRDTLARLGGDEFGILLEHCPFSVAERIAQGICDQMETYRFAQDGRRFRVGASIGLVPVDARWSSIIPMLQAADACCSMAKDTGRNRVQIWQDSDQTITTRQAEQQWANRLERALDEDRFQLFAQTVVALTAGAKGRNIEVLLRLQDEDALILPGVFMAAAERFNLATRIDLWVLRQTITVLNARSDLADFSMIGVNLSGRSIGDRAFHRQAITLLRAAGADLCSRLFFEITETSTVANMTDASLFIEQLHSLGVRVALDDFGAGATSFGYLRTIKADSLKIDGQFVQGLLTDDLSRVAIRCFVDIAKVVGMSTVAEYVDHPALLDMVRDLGVDFAQGFLLGKPELFTADTP